MTKAEMLAIGYNVVSTVLGRSYNRPTVEIQLRNDIAANTHAIQLPVSLLTGTTEDVVEATLHGLILSVGARRGEALQGRTYRDKRYSAIAGLLGLRCVFKAGKGWEINRIDLARLCDAIKPRSPVKEAKQTEQPKPGLKSYVCPTCGKRIWADTEPKAVCLKCLERFEDETELKTELIKNLAVIIAAHIKKGDIK